MKEVMSCFLVVKNQTSTHMASNPTLLTLRVIVKGLKILELLENGNRSLKDEYKRLSHIPGNECRYICL